MILVKIFKRCVMKKTIVILIVGASLSTGLMAESFYKTKELQKADHLIQLFDEKLKDLKLLKSCIKNNIIKTQKDIEKKCYKEIRRMEKW